MNPKLTILFFFAVFSFSACQEKPKKTRLSDRGVFKLDSAGRGLFLDTTGSRPIVHYQQVPEFIRTYLNSRDVVPFTVADPEEDFNKGCELIPGVPDKQMIWAVIHKNYFLMDYWYGGNFAGEETVLVSIKDKYVVSVSFLGNPGPYHL